MRRVAPYSVYMKHGLTLLAVALSLGLAGCGKGDLVASLQPFFEEGDLYDDPEALQYFEKKSVGIERVSIGKYRIAVEKDKPDEVVIVHLFRLGGTSFWDVQQESGTGLAIRPHLVVRVTKGEESGLAGINAEGFRRLAESKAVSLDHLEAGEFELLTAPTSKLREFLREHANDPAIFDSEAFTIRCGARTPPPPPPQR